MHHQWIEWPIMAEKFGVYTAGKHNPYLASPMSTFAHHPNPHSFILSNASFHFIPVNKQPNLLRTKRWWIHGARANHLVILCLEEAPNPGCPQSLIPALNRIFKDFCFSMGSCSSNLSTLSNSLVTALLVWGQIVLYNPWHCYLNYSEQRDFSAFRYKLTW